MTADSVLATLEAQQRAIERAAEFCGALTEALIDARAQIALHHRAIDALTEQLEQCATRDDLDSLRSELRSIIAEHSNV